VVAGFALGVGAPSWRSRIQARQTEYSLKSARRLSPHVERLVETIFGAHDELLHLRCVQAVVKHVQTFPASRAQAAA
jgi:hypothetical protein